MSGTFRVQRLPAADVRLMQELSAVFGEAFDDVATYGGARPSEAYLERGRGPAPEPRAPSPER